MSFEDLLVTGASWALAVAGVWSLLVCVAAAVEVLSAGHWALTARLGCPAGARRALLVGVGLVLTGGAGAVSGPASAAPVPLRTDARAASALPVPARPTGSTQALPQQRVAVRPGDN